jgi:uncharacterized protein (TIGR03437 family)
LGFTTGTGANSTTGSASITYPILLNNTQVLLTYWDYSAHPAGYTSINLPILMVSSNQINAMVPFEVYNAIPGSPPAPSQLHNASLIVLGSSSSSPSIGNLLVVNEDPGIFSLSATGVGQGAVVNCVNSGWTINGPKNAIPRGSPICIYGTGLGILAASPPLAVPTPIPAGFGTDESVAPATAYDISDPVGVTIGGVPAVVTYAGTSPGSIGGLAQINAIVPPTATTGSAVPILIIGGTQAAARQSQPGVTIAIK